MHSIAVIFVISSVWGQKEFPIDNIREPDQDDYVDDLDDGLLRCFSCSTLLGDRGCENLTTVADGVRRGFVLKCSEQHDEVPSPCIFKKDDEFARAVGLEEANEDDVGHSMVIESCPDGVDCNIGRSSIQHPFLRKLLHRPTPSKRGMIPYRRPVTLYPGIRQQTTDRTYTSANCFKFNAKGMDGRGFTIRGCAINNVDGCLIGDFIDTGEIECHLCNEHLCNGANPTRVVQVKPFLKDRVTLLIFIEALRFIFK